MTEEIKIMVDNSHDVESVKRGFIDVKIKKEYDGSVYEYDTTFLSNNINKSEIEDGN